MSRHAHHPVVVGVDETPAGQRGIRFAALEARRLDTWLSIVHVTPGYTVSAGLPPVPDDVLQAYGLGLLEGARKHAQATVPDLEVETTLVGGTTSVHGLVDASAEAALLVLGAERRSFAGRVWTGDIVAGVAAQATCPVVVVPPEWEPAHEHGRIVVAVKDAEQASELVAAGLGLASETRAELVILHAWKAPSGYDDIISRRTFAKDHEARQAALLESVVNALHAEHPSVAVRTEIAHAQPAHELVQASAHADRLLVSRPVHGGGLHHLGGVGRAVIQESRCAVEVHPATTPDARPASSHEVRQSHV